MAEKDPPKTPTRDDPQAERSEPVIPGYWGPNNLLVYGDISRLLFRMHRNVAVHADAHRRLMERLQSVFAHEQALVLELARVIDEVTGQAARPGEGRPALGAESMERVFEHASKAMEESGKMLTDIQLESLALLKHYIEDMGGTSEKPSDKTENAKE